MPKDVGPGCSSQASLCSQGRRPTLTPALVQAPPSLAGRGQVSVGTGHSFGMSVCAPRRRSVCGHSGGSGSDGKETGTGEEEEERRSPEDVCLCLRVTARTCFCAGCKVALGERATAEPGRRAGDAQSKGREPRGPFAAGGACAHGSPVLIGHAYSWLTRAHRSRTHGSHVLMGHTYMDHTCSS